jgi:hypothetical protein
MAALLSACAGPERLSAVPQSDIKKATVLGISNARYFVDEASEMLDEGRKANEREAAYHASRGHRGPLPPANFLAVSGGGEDGAFGAGLLVGWSERGDRPTFKLVTGISTGALIAPFAFLGSEDDPVLTTVYTTVDQKSIFESRPFHAALTDDALADTSPMYRLIEKYLDERMLVRIGQEYDKGRLLLIATTNLDAARPMIWNIGAIAKSGHPEALKLVRRVLLASAAVPAAFPPVMIDVDVDGKRYQELHVDGGAVAQAFLYPAAISARQMDRGAQRGRIRKAYIIRNSRLSAPWAQTSRSTMTIAGRAISTLIASSGVGDMYRMYATTQRDGVSYNLAFIDSDFTEVSPAMFNREYMNKLFNYGRAKGRAGYPWRHRPPGLAQ